MKKKNRINIRSKIAFLCTVLILCVIDFSFVLSTSSKFSSKENGALAYQADWYSLYTGKETFTDEKITNLQVDENNSKILTISFDFPRHRELAYDISDTNKDNYYITVDNCSFKVDGKEEDSISFSDNSVEKVNITLSCNYDNLLTKASPTVSVNIKENFGDESVFDYKDYSFTITEDYYNNVLNPYKWENPLVVPVSKTDDERVEEFVKWINTYAESTDQESKIKEYIYNNTNFDYEEVVKKTKDNTKNPIVGIKIGFSPKVEYTYTLEDNFLGYVRTDPTRANKSFMYFYTQNKEEIENAFAYYLKADGVYTEEEIEILMEYINARGGIASVVKGEKYILGLTYLGPSNSLILDDKLLDYAKSLKNPNTTLVNFDQRSMMLHYVSQFIESKDFVSDYMKSKTIDSYYINFVSLLGNSVEDVGYNIVIKNNLKDYSIPKSFVEYYVVEDTGNAIKDSNDEVKYKQYLFFKIYSDIEKESTHTYNFYELDTLVVPGNIEITFENTDDDTLTIEVYADADTEAEAKDNIKNILISLNNYFDSDNNRIDIDNVNITYNSSLKFGYVRVDVSKGYNDLIPSSGN